MLGIRSISELFCRNKKLIMGSTLQIGALELKLKTQEGGVRLWQRVCAAVGPAVTPLQHFQAGSWHSYIPGLLFGSA